MTVMDAKTSKIEMDWIIFFLFLFMHACIAKLLKSSQLNYKASFAQTYLLFVLNDHTSRAGWRS
jgi:hypothetical protein